jgi:hypothetical protein
MHNKFVVPLFVMVGFNRLLIAPVIGSDGRSASRLRTRYPSDVMRKGELMETKFDHISFDILDISHPSRHESLNRIVVDNKILIDERLNDGRECRVEENKIFTDERLTDVRECQHGEGCQKQATYGNIDDNLPSFCVKHAFRGNVFVKRGNCRCRTEQCCQSCGLLAL